MKSLALVPKAESLNLSWLYLDPCSAGLYSKYTLKLQYIMKDSSKEGRKKENESKDLCKVKTFF